MKLNEENLIFTETGTMTNVLLLNVISHQVGGFLVKIAIELRSQITLNWFVALLCKHLDKQSLKTFVTRLKL